MAKWFLLGFIVLIAAEVTAFALVGAGIGLWQAFALLAATSIGGLIVLRLPGRASLDRMRVAVTQSGIAGVEAGGEAFLTVSAGILLLIPGFITDGLGFLLLLSPVRRWIAARFRRFVRTQQGAPSVVTLDSEEWSRIPERSLEQRQTNDRG